MSYLTRFPTFKEIFPSITPQRTAKYTREYLRYFFHRMLCRRECQDLVLFLNQNTLWRRLLAQDPYRFNTLLAKYCDNRFNAQARLTAITTHFKVAEKKLGLIECERLITQNEFVLAQLTENLILKLTINQIDPFEGFFTISIQNQQRHLYDASFSFLSENQILIASIQGPKGHNAQDIVRNMTKQLHGIRPMFMLVHAFQLLAAKWNCELLGIPHKYQAKYRWNDSSRLLFDYNHFWQENRSLLQHGYWHIPPISPRKPLEEVQSKKRSMYRKRYDMLDRLKDEINAYLS